ncbi:hypothetical protein CHGG_09974 [Chaetomium globosum CBS 148.51]|uniref:F-box domain-containing protein n=1 Tax=Chaetomium globosum (strain ATCC 6205 / CBS 148.51 / DSM 1962 / NBRC 6347 / NRRL 1970) TaxID=306901 RepID=Q2GPY0_CHAGB|nr:uncharacterized protein CHGG_09974 [Chaetomium globosum CBS 148.51]EAQ83570.1 hypothetical protein CHGG_09974 [Chaetomium globosum CBS 148.51]
MATLASLPNEILIAIAGYLADIQDLAALALTNRRFFSIANPGLYATAARNYKPVLFYCAENGLIGPMNSLLTHGADPDRAFRSPISRDSLNRALAAQGRRPGRRPLMDWKLILEETTSRTREVLERAIVHDELCELKARFYADTSKRSSNLIPRAYHPRRLREPASQAATPLYFAILAGHKSTVRLLLARGASIVVSSGGITPLHLAAWCGDLELCRLLLDETPRQEVDSWIDARLTPFHYAVAGGHLQTVGRFLLQRGADIQADFEGDLLPSYCVPYSMDGPVNAFGLALCAHKYRDALMLLHMNPDFARKGHERPWQSSIAVCLQTLPIERSDDMEGLVVSILRNLFLHSQDYTKHIHSFENYYILALSRDLPQFLSLMLEDAEVRGLSLASIERWVYDALQSIRSSPAVDAVMALIQYAVSKQRMPLPCLSRVFPPLLSRGWSRFEDMSKARFEARLEMAKLVYHLHLSADPRGVSDSDLHDALLNACQAGGLKLCQWLASLGALRLMDKNDFAALLDQAARKGDELLTGWVLTQAENAGHKRSIMDGICLWDIIALSGVYETAILFAHHGANINVALEKPRCLGAVYPLFSCRTRQRTTIQEYRTVHYGSNIFFKLCSRPDLTGAVELCRLAIHAAGEDAEKLFSCSFLTGQSGTLSPISLICSIRSPFEINSQLSVSPPCDHRPARTNVDDEPARLAMLRMVLDAGAAEVHTLAEVVNRGEAEDYEQPSELLWHALASEDTHEIGRQQALTSNPNGSPVWRVHNWQSDPIRCAIRNGFPKLVQTMLETRPLPTRNHPAACVTWRLPAVKAGESTRETAFYLKLSALCSPWPTWTMQIYSTQTAKQSC